MKMDHDALDRLVLQREKQYAFLQSVYLSNAIRDCLNRGEPVYADTATGPQKQALRENLKFELRELAHGYRSRQVNGEDHVKNIRQLSERLTRTFGDILKEGDLRLGGHKKR